MDDPNRRRRQNEPPIHPSSNPRYQQPGGHDSLQQRRSYAGTPSDRYRTGPANTASPTAARGMGGSASYSGYYQEPPAGFQTAAGMPQGAMGYQQSPADYTQDARQTQGFAGAYNPTTMMYNVQPPGGQNPVYDTSQQFSSRQPAAMQMMATDVAGSYFQSEPTNTAAASAMQQQTAGSSSSSAVYQQSSADRSAMLQGYSSSMGSIGGMPPQTAAGSAPDVSMEDQQEYPQSTGLDEAYTSYQSALKEIFQDIRNSVLAAASESLLSVSDWLLSHVAELGLTSDDQNLHNDRIKLWNDFNHAWLAMLQRQKDLMEAGQQLARGQTLISQVGLEKMGKELIRLCDSIERHGLVDYQYGVWEEQIITVLTECVDLYEPGSDAGTSSHR